MNKIHLYSFYVVVFLFSGFAMAQDKGKKGNDIGTEVVDIVRPYEASISDAFKISETPKVDDEYNTQKRTINYSINSFPVASTFIPEKGIAAKVENEPKNKLFNNYARIGVGNYFNVNGDLFLSHNINNTDVISGSFNIFNSKGGIKGLLLDDYFRKIAGEIIYGQKKELYNWDVNLLGKYQISNWYGLPVRDFDFSSFNARDINEEQIYRTIGLGGKIEFNKSAWSFVEARYKGFIDDFQSTENRFFAKSKVSTSIKDTAIDINLIFDYVGTKYEEIHNIDKSSTKKNNLYRHLSFGIEPSVYFSDDWYSLKLGAGVYVDNSKLNGKSKIFPHIYPNISATFNLVDNILLSYIGAEGTLKQNSYMDFVDINPFISPVNTIIPTSQLYDVYAGLKGRFDNNISYNIKGSYKREIDKAFFKTRSLKGMSGNFGYEYGNSFDVVYDNLNTLSLYGELRFDFEKTVSIGVNGELNQYITPLEEAWNMPIAKLGADVRVDIDKDWFAGAGITVVGERKDVASVENLTFVQDVQYPVKTLKPYVDLNVELGYRITKKWTAFLSGNNLFNKKYEKWNNYNVQGAQFMLGVMYKFDF